MKLYIKQKVFSFKDKFSIFDENENVKFTCEGEIFTLGKKLHLYDVNGEECAYIHQKLISFLPRYFVNMGGEDVAEVVKKITLLKPKYVINGLGWSVEGDFWAHDYRITHGDRIVAVVSKKWFAWGDTYEVFTAKDGDMKMALSIVLIIDAILAQQAAANSAAHSSHSSSSHH